MPHLPVRAVWYLTVALFAALTAQFLTSESAYAATITVTTAADTIDADGGGCVGLDIASLPGPDTFVSLREAICASNGTAGADSIGFNIPGAGVKTITLGSALPALTEAVVIDGFTQSGASPNTTPFGQADNAVILIELDHNGARSLVIQSADVTVRGLSIGGATGFNFGILVSVGTNVRIIGNRIGLRADGETIRGNPAGVFVTADGVTIGTAAAADRNIISGGSSGVFGGALEGQILNNYIGTNAAGTADRPNGTGVELSTSGNNFQIGAPGAGNLISGNFNGVLRFGASRVQSNYIGTNAAGNAPLPNVIGIYERGSLEGEVGIIGTDGDGVNDAAEGNLISGNFGAGIEFVTFNTVGTVLNGVTIAGNKIGTNAAGTAAIPNGIGIDFSGSLKLGNITVGGTTPATRNVISGNTSHGISWPTGDNNTHSAKAIIGNFIGTNAAGTEALPNGGDGIRFSTSVAATRVRVGGTANGEANVIRHNGGGGVVVTGTTPLPVRGNAIDQNTGLGIDLANNGVTANDVNDGDAGANGLQNFPVLTSVVVTGGTAQANGTLNSTANTTFDVDLYASPSCDASGNGEGRRFLGTTSVTTVGNNAAFSLNVTGVAVGEPITATATSPTLQTSEFSACTQATLGGPGVTVSKTAVSVVERGANDTFTVALTSVPATTVTVTLAFDNAQLTASPITLTFQPDASALTPQLVTVSAVADATPESTQTSPISFTTASSTAAFNGLSVPNVTATITDVAAGVTVSKTAVAVAEGGAGDSFTVALTSIPGSTVTVTVAFDNAQLTVAPTTLTFQPNATALTGQTVTVNAVDDATGEGAHSSNLTFTTASATSAFNGLSVVPVTANISDNDGTVSPNNSDEPTKRGDRDSKKDKESEESKQQRERTNRSGQDDYRNEGNVVEVYADADPPYIIVANRDGLVKIVLYGEAAKAAGSIKVGDYLEADGEKINELLFEATDVSFSRPP